MRSLLNFHSFRNMRISWKNGLVVVLMLIPIVSLLGVVLTGTQRIRATTARELRGVEYLGPLYELSQHLPIHRGLAQSAAQGNAKDKEPLPALQGLIDGAFKTLQAVDEKLGKEFTTGDKVAQLVRTWGELQRHVRDLKVGQAAVEQSFEEHALVINELRSLMQHVGDRSGLILDFDLAPYYLASSFLRVVPSAQEPLALMQVYGNSAVQRQVITLEEQTRLRLLANEGQKSIEELYRALESVYRGNPALEPALAPEAAKLYAKTDAFVQMVHELVRADTIKITPQEYATTASETLQQYAVFSKLLLKTLDQELRVRQSRDTWTMIIETGVALFLTLCAVALAMGVNRIIVRQVRSLTALFGEIALGNYEARAEVASGDELGTMAASLNTMLDNTLALIQSQEERDSMQSSIMKLLEEVAGVADGDLTIEADVTADMTGAIADSFNYMIQQLRAVVSHVQDATLQVSASANEIQATAEHLAQGSTAQAAQIMDSSAALDEMAVSIQQVSENAALSATVAEQALANAKQGAQAVHNTIEGMQRIRGQVQETSKRIKRLGERSQEIGDIVQLIGDIADRTSILALNASIQAARAGEAGRAFVVVAEEVERLAERSSNATKQIAGLVNTIQSETNEAVTAMEESTREVVQGSRLADQAGQTLNEIQSVSDRLADLIHSISLAAQQQARGSESLSQAMGEISDVTQQTAAGTKQAAVSINNLASLADELRSSVEAFKLPSSANGHQE